MKKQVFIFYFPMSRATINVETSPLCVKDLAIQYISKQGSVFGDICLIKDGYSNDIWAIACANSDFVDDVKFFTEDESVNDIVPIAEEEGGDNDE